MDLNRLKTLAGVDTLFEEASIKKGAFHKWLGKDESAPITKEDIAKGLASNDEHVRKMAQFAKNMQESLKESAPSDEEEFVKSAKDDFKKRYGNRWRQVLYATAWKKHNKKSTNENYEISDAIYGLIKLQENSGIQVPFDRDMSNENKQEYYVYDRCKRKGHTVMASTLDQAVKYVAPTAELYQGDPENASQDATARYLDDKECQYQAFPKPAQWGVRESEEQAYLDSINEEVGNGIPDQEALNDTFADVHSKLSQAWPKLNNEARRHLNDQFSTLANANKRGYDNPKYRLVVQNKLFQLEDELSGFMASPEYTIRESINDSKKLANQGTGDNPAKPPVHDSEFPKIKFMNNKAPDNELTLTNVEFNDDKMEFNKVMTGADVAESTKVRVPRDVIKHIDTRKKDLIKSIEQFDGAAYTDDGAIYKSPKHNAIDALDKFKELLTDCNMEKYKQAQIYYATLMSPIFDLLPTQLVSFLHTGQPYQKKD